MKLTKRKMLLVSFMLFSLFFGAGNLIFPPFLGQNAGQSTPTAFFGFLLTAVLLPVLGVIVIAKFNGLEKLARKVNRHFAIVFTIIIYLAIGPGLGIPRAASVPFEMAIMPYLPESANPKIFMLIYSLIFFLIASWLALAPNKLVDRIGKFLTPSLLILLTSLFICFVFLGKKEVAPAQAAYQTAPLVVGFLEGYNTMDTIAALNFGLVIATTLKALSINNEKDIIKHTICAGAVAGTILTLIYAMLSYMGMQSSGVYSLQGNGAWTLRCIVHQIFGDVGAVLLAVTFTLACLTTCVGLINSISQYFSTLTPKISYTKWVIIITVFSFAICNQGLNTILSISVPVLNIVYPVAITLILLGLCDYWLRDNKIVYPLTIAAVSVVSVLYAIHSMGILMPALETILPFFNIGMGWVIVAIVAVVISVIASAIINSKDKSKAK